MSWSARTPRALMSIFDPPEKCRPDVCGPARGVYNLYMRHVRLILACVCLFLAAPACADIVHLKTGSKLEGEIIERADGIVRIRMSSGIIATVKEEDVVAIEQRQTPRDVYEAMARSKLLELATEAKRRWPVVKCAVVHRLGHLAVGETSVAVAVSAAHRRDAFEAAGWLIDEIKRVVPIWKKENRPDGTGRWIHPAVEPPAEKADETDP